MAKDDNLSREKLLKGNVLWNLMGSLLPAIAQFVCIPFYIKALGIDAYGLVSLYFFLNTAILVFDLGLIPAVNRALAKLRSSDSNPGKYAAAISTFQTVGLVLITSGAASLYLFSDLLTEEWLTESGETAAEILPAIIVLVIIRWFILFYASAGQGLKKHIAINLTNIVFSLLASVGVLFWMLVRGNQIDLFFQWLLIVTASHLLVIILVVWRQIWRVWKTVFSRQIITEYWKFGSLMVALSIIGIFITMTDKWVAIYTVSMHEYGKYGVAMSLNTIITIIIGPIYLAFFSRFNRLIDDQDALCSAYYAAIRFMVLLLIPIGLLVGIYSYQLIDVWTRDSALAADLAYVVRVYAFGTVMNGIMHIPFAMHVASGRLLPALYLNIGLLLLTIPLTFQLCQVYGISGAATAWMIINICYLIAGFYIASKTFFTSASISLYIQPVLLTMAVSALLLGASKLVLKTSHAGSLLQIVVSLVSLSAVIAILLLSSRNFRAALSMAFEDN
jgi:O-antigen/teichoic acid export membrane protein